ncbi:MAG: transglutaminaseTgpA domain-containing protein [Syntrophorhabdaceae bacterium]|nr:transglutaminaseTgpA domain-containing protein [Syntrophorhabdaceae bacterium]
MKVVDLKSIKIIHIVKVFTYAIGVISFLSIARYISFVYSGLFLLIFSISVYFEYKNRFFIPRWIINLFSLGIVAYTIYRINTDELVIQLVEALLIIFAVKFLEEKKTRDYMQIYTLSLFLLAGLGLLSLDIVFSVYLIIVVIMLSLSSVLLTFYSQDPEMELDFRTILKIIFKSLYIPCVAIPLTVVMFVILPRTQYPILNFLNRPDKAKTGFTESVRLGAVSNIQEDASIIMRVHMERIRDEDLYWRGIVLDYFDGISWKSSKKQYLNQNQPVIVPGASVKQVIYLEPYENRYIFGLDKPVFISLKGIKRLEDLSYVMPSPIERRLRYEVLSVMSHVFYEHDIDKTLYLQVPENISERIRQLAKILASGNDILNNIQAVYNFFNDGSFRYSLKNLPVSRTPLEDFLFKNKYGNCEYFASAFAVILRLAGIPSRLVGGYRGGYYNDVGKYYLVPQKNAHVWVEAYINGKGWMRFDPTPVAYETFGLGKKKDIILQIRLIMDTINFYWYAFVINYNLDRQLSIAFAITQGIKRPHLKLDIKNLAFIKYVAIFLSVLILSFFSIKAFMRRQDKERYMLWQFYRRLNKYGYKKRASQGLEEFVSIIKDENLKEKAREFVVAFEESFYRDKKLSRMDIKRLKRIIKAI